MAKLTEAEKRRRRFLKNKKDAGGTIAELQMQVSYADVYIYFDDDGEIMAVSPTKQKLGKGIKEEIFTREQASILENVDTTGFRIRQDSNVDTVFIIENKPIESVFVKSEDDFVKLVEFNKSKTADITVTTKDKMFMVTLSKKQKTKYKKIATDEATAKGSKALKFYFTSKNDPHFMIYSINVKLPDLITKDEVAIPIPANLHECSIYTIGLFDTYSRN
jgi:hypothetical protein